MNAIKPNPEEKAKISFLWEPGSEQEVCLLFGYLMPYIGKELERLLGARDLRFDEWREDPTDCLFEVGGEEKNIEFEYYSSNFRGNHDPEKCDLIVCWKHFDSSDTLRCWKNGEAFEVKVLALSKIVKDRFPELIET